MRGDSGNEKRRSTERWVRVPIGKSLAELIWVKNVTPFLGYR